MVVTRIQRLLRLIMLLRSGKPHDPDSLAATLGVARRTVFRDLDLLQRAGIPYRFSRVEGGYQIAETALLPPLHLTLEESLALLMVIRKFIVRPVHPTASLAMNAAMKIEGLLPESIRSYCGGLLERIEVRWPPMTTTDAAMRAFGQLEEAIAGNRRVTLTYDSLTEQREIRTTVEPYRLLFRFPGWYLFGRSSLHGEVRTFKLDRIRGLEPLAQTFTPDSSFSLEQKLGKAWRLIPEGRVYSIRLRFEPKVARNVEEVQWHDTQRTKRLADGRLEFTAEVDGLGEILWWILGYGDQVVVEEPPELRDRHRDMCARAAARYPSA